MSPPVRPLACSGSLLSRSFLERIAKEVVSSLDAQQSQQFRALVRQSYVCARAGARAVADVFAEPFAKMMGFDTRGWRAGSENLSIATLLSAGRPLALIAALPFREPVVAGRGTAISAAAGHGLRWCLLTNGLELMLLDCARPHARRWLKFDLAECAADVDSLRALHAVASVRSLSAGPDGRVPLEEMMARSDADLHAVRVALQAGVERAALALATALDRSLDRVRVTVDELFEQALTVVYRILFLQFAEARNLVPTWHPTYRRGYTISALRESIQAKHDRRGLWEALQAIARLAHLGADAGDLKVVAFNGRLFSPAHAPALARGKVPDGSAAEAVTALSCVHGGRGIASPYSDLDVEQLGSIYERVLDFTPVRGTDHEVRLRRGSARKNSGSFYTPRALTEFLIRQALEPLTREATPEQLLELRVLDPAMGSGAFLVAACRYLARAYEQALVRSGAAGDGDFSPVERAGFRRLIAQRCLYGVDLNPMAVQLGRLSLWLCSLAAERPLTFLDHRLRVGNSVLGTSLEAISLRAPGGRERTRPTLFRDDALEAVGKAKDIRHAMACIPDDTVAQVHEKEKLLAALDSESGPLAAWRRICDLWCAWWFWSDESAPPSSQEFGALCDALKGSRSLWSAPMAARLQTAARVAREERFFHWPLEFPEVLFRGGFDVVIGNPPWDMVRGDAPARRTLRFTRDSGTFRLQSSGHGNLYQLFLERALQLVRPSGRIGMLVPWGVATDEGSAPLRRHLLDCCSIDELVILDNANGIFPIHRALKFGALVLQKGGRTDALRYPPPVRDLSALERADLASVSRARVELGRSLLTAFSGASLALPLVSDRSEVRVLERLIAAAAPAADRSGWGLRFSRELNASDDRALFSDATRGWPVISGRHIEPFSAHPERSSLRIDPRRAFARLGKAVNRHRLAYRDVAGPGNRVTLIAAIVPPRVVTTHTLFCLQTELELPDQWFLCGILNSYVANYLVRTRVGTHVTTALVHNLPVPRPARESAAFTRIARLARDGGGPELQGSVAALYGLDDEMWTAVLQTFPLVPLAERDAARAALTAFAPQAAV